MMKNSSKKRTAVLFASVAMLVMAAGGFAAPASSYDVPTLLTEESSQTTVGGCRACDLPECGPLCVGGWLFRKGVDVSSGAATASASGDAACGTCNSEDECTTSGSCP